GVSSDAGCADVQLYRMPGERATHAIWRRKFFLPATDYRLLTTLFPMPLYPLKFKPRLLEKIWGGRKFETVLGKPLPAGKLIGESWELYDFPPGTVEDSAD